MVERYRKINALDYLNLLLEGVGLALRDLGVDFRGLTRNIWEDLNEQRPVPFNGEKSEAPLGSGAFFPSSIVTLVNEVVQLLFELLTIPSKFFLAGAHASVRSVINTREELFEMVSKRIERVLEITRELQDINWIR